MLCILWEEGFHSLDKLPAAVMMADTELHLPYSTASHRRRHQPSHTVQSKPQCLLKIMENRRPEFLLLIPLHFKCQTSQPVSHSLLPSYRSTVNSRYSVSRRILQYPPVCRNTTIYTHRISQTVRNCTIGLVWTVLPAAESWGWVEWNLISKFRLWVFRWKFLGESWLIV
jgi:hypothetical protein